MNNYPPGVTGNEYEIAGPDYMQHYSELCPECGGEMTQLGYRYSHWVSCNDCNYTEDIDIEGKWDTDERV